MGTYAPWSAGVELDWGKPSQIYDVCGTALRPAGKVRRPAPACEGGPSQWETAIQQERTWLLETALHPQLSWWSSGEAWQDTDLVKVDLWSGSAYTFQAAKVPHRQGFVLYLQAGCNLCLSLRRT